MRIGIDISQVVYEGTGVATYTANLVENLLKIDTKNQYVLFGASLRKRNVLEDFAQGLRNQGLKFQTSFWLVPPTFIEQIWNEVHHVKVERLLGKVDVFHSSDWAQPPTKAKKVTTIHDLIVYKYPESSHQRLTFNFKRFAPLPDIVATQKRRLEWVKNECDLIITDSVATKRDCQQILALPARRIRVVYLAAGKDYEQFRDMKQEVKVKEIEKVKKKYNLNRKYVLAIGTREPRKNLDRLIQAFNGLSIRGTDLVIAGKYGWGDNNFARQVGGSNLKLLGYVPQEDLPALCAGANVFVYPSLYEGFGIPILEAMTVGTPVITSKISSMPEAGGNAAIYVNPQDEKDIRSKLGEVINLTESGRQALIRKGYAQANKFSWEKTARQTLRIYEQLAKG